MPVTVFSAQPKSAFLRRVVVILVFFTSCTTVTDQDRAAIDSALADSTSYESETWGVTMELLEDGQRFVHITSPYAVSNEQGANSSTVLYGPVYIEVRNEQGDPETYVSAGRVIYLSSRSEFYLDGGVNVQTVDQKTLRTESLTWYQFFRSIEAEGAVTIITPADSIVGVGLKGDDRLIIYTLDSVSGTFTIEDENDTDSDG
jgi:LPS export ABC transporter protein LptC